MGATEVYAAVRGGCDEEPIRSLATFTRDLYALADWLRACEVDTVAMESTGVYWIVVHQILEARGFEVVLVNAGHVRSVPQPQERRVRLRLAPLPAVGRLGARLVPTGGRGVHALRSLSRHRGGLVKTGARSLQHMQKA